MSNAASPYPPISDNIVFDNSKVSSDVKTSGDTESGDPFIYKLTCNKDFTTTLDDQITNGKLYNVYWYKNGETNKVEENYSNMWTHYGDSAQTLKIKLTNLGDTPFELTAIKRYDLVIYNIQSGDAGTYSCKAVSAGSTVVLGTTTLTVGTGNNMFTLLKELTMFD